MNDKFLTESAWKAVTSKFKIKDNGLLRALADYAKIEDDDHDELLEAIDALKDFATDLKKSKEIAANAAVTKYLAEMLNAIQGEQRETAKAKADAEKARAVAEKAKAEAEKAEAAAQKAEARAKQMGGAEEDEEEQEEDDEQGDYEEKLKAAFQKLKGAKDAVYQFILCDAKPVCAVMIAKRITARHKQELTELTGCKRFLKIGTCWFEDGKFNFSMEDPVSGLARKLQASIKNYTGKKLPIVVGDETAADDEEPSPAEPALQSRQAPADPDRPRTTGVMDDPPRPPGDIDPPASNGSPTAQPAAAFTAEARAQAEAWNKANVAKVVKFDRATSGRFAKRNGQLDADAVARWQVEHGLPATGKADDATVAAATQAKSSGSKPQTAAQTPGRAQPLPPPMLGRAKLEKAPEVWHHTRDILDTNIEALKQAILSHYSGRHPALLDEIDSRLGNLDAILDKLDHRLADSMAKAHAAGDDTERKTELKNAKAILTDYIQYVKSEPLIAHIDSNPFGVATNLKKVLVDSLTHMAQAIA